MIARATLLALLLLATADAIAQPKRVVAFVMAPCEFAESRSRAMAEALGRLGWRVPSQLRVEPKCVAENPEAAAVAAVEVVRSRPDAVVTTNTVATLALARATSSIPIVTSVGDPVLIGVAASLSRPGGNVTGLSQSTPESTRKQLEILRRLLPRIDHLLLVDVVSPYRATWQEAARGMNIATVMADSSPSDTLRRRIAELPMGGRSAVLLVEGLVGPDASALTQEMLDRKLAIIAYSAEHVEKGVALMAYELVWRDPDARQAALLDKVLRGGNPGELPFESPTESLLTINRRMAEMLGIVVPQDLQLLAIWTN